MPAPDLTPSPRTFRVAVIGLSSPLSTFLKRLIIGLSDTDLEILVPESTLRDFQDVNVAGYWLPAWDGSLPSRAFALLGLCLRYLFLSGPARTCLRGAMSEAVGLKAKMLEFYNLVPLLGLKADLLYFPWNETAVSLKPLLSHYRSIVSCRGAHVNIAPHNPRRNHLKVSLPETFEMAAAVHCVSRDICEEATRYGLARRKATVIEPAVDTQSLRPVGQKEVHPERLEVISTGSLIWRKGYEYALCAMGLLRDAGIPVRFHVVGAGADEERVVYTIHDLSLQDVVILHGRRPENEVSRLLHASHVFLLSSLSEGISNAVLEAMACGLPIVTTDCGGMREAVTHGVEGLLVSRRDSRAIAEALTRLSVDPPMRLQMGTRARERAVRQFDLKDQVRSFASLFHEVLSDSNGGDRGAG